MNYKRCIGKPTVGSSPIAYTSNDDYRKAFVWERLRKYVDVL